MTQDLNQRTGRLTTNPVLFAWFAASPSTVSQTEHMKRQVDGMISAHCAKKSDLSVAPFSANVSPESGLLIAEL